MMVLVVVKPWSVVPILRFKPVGLVQDAFSLLTSPDCRRPEWLGNDGRAAGTTNGQMLIVRDIAWALGNSEICCLCYKLLCVIDSYT